MLLLAKEKFFKNTVVWSKSYDTFYIAKASNSPILNDNKSTQIETNIYYIWN